MTITVTKISVTCVQPKLYRIVLNLLVKDGEVECINRDFPGYHRTGDLPSVTVDKFKVDMQAAIDNYKAERGIFTAPEMDTAIASLQGQLVY